jgi:ABC-2 type transport system ATP-binding protein
MSHAPSSSPLAALRSARKHFGKIRALDGLDLDVRRGELLAVLGPNGAGKSTAISLLLGLELPDGGTVELFGLDPRDLEARRRVGIMMQEVALAPVATPREHIAQVASYYPSPYEVNAVIRRLSLEKLADRRYSELSGGQKRQVQFAMAICGRPELLFLDEPTVGLDIQAREALWKVLRELVHEGSSIVLTTHYLEEAEALANRVAVIARGRQIAAGTVDEIRAVVSRKNIACRTTLAATTIREWPEVEQLREDGGRLHLVTQDAEALLRRLLAADTRVSDVEVRRAGLAEAFAELTSAEPSSAGAQPETLQ